MTTTTPQITQLLGRIAELEAQQRTLHDDFAMAADIPWDVVIETLKLKGIENPTVEDMVTYRSGLKYSEAYAMMAERAKRIKEQK
jgi:hypothetical protein